MKITVIGLGYVGLPLARLFATKYATVGFDLKASRVEELKKGYDSTLEVSDNDLKAVLLSSNPDKNSIGLFCSSSVEDIMDSNIYIVTVPTPIDEHRNPDLTPLIKASETVGRVINKHDIVIYESTVYPGVTEECCIPVIERTSGLIFNKDFFAGYSPERINPGDKMHTVENIKKVTSGSTSDAALIVDELYKSVISAGTFLASSIKVAEASKVIENSQRDINIAFVNELAKIFNLMGIDTNDVLDAAGTKWNFLKFKPGLVGGHCIGIDPYYLAQKAQDYGYHPAIILAGRRLNDSMGGYVADEVIRLMNQKGILIKNSDVLVLGITFKENCPDVRNTKVIDIINTLKRNQVNVTVSDPWANIEDVYNEYGISMKTSFENEKFDAIILAVSHDEFLSFDVLKYCRPNVVIYDVKNVLDREIVDGRL